MPQDWLSRIWGETLDDDLDRLLRDLCVGWGFCNRSVSGRDLLRDGGGLVTAQAVAEATLDAEGDVDPRWRDAVERLFSYRYGARSVAQSNYPPKSMAPYTVAPDPPKRDPADEDPILAYAREFVRDDGGSSARVRPALETEAVMSSIRRARGRKSFAVGPREHDAARDDLATLIALHEQLTGCHWNSDPEARRGLGLAPGLGLLAKRR